jgi:predicted ATPase
VFSGTGEELGQTAPLLPLLTALGVRAASPEPRRAEVLRILRGQDGATAAAEALLELIDELCAESPAVLVVDDLHWADAVTVSVCHRLAHSVIQRPLLLVGAIRPLPRRDDLRALRRAVGREGLVRLGPLPPAAVAELVARNVGGRPGPGLARLTADAAGNPLYLTELVDALDRAHRLTVAAGQADVIGAGAPATLSEAIRDRIDFLGGAVREVLQAAALLGGEFAVDDLAVVTGRTSADLAALLAEARTAGVVTDAGRRLTFRHPLIRTALYDELAVPVRAARHRDAARALWQAGASATRVARQLLPTLDERDQDEVDDWVVGWLVDNAAVLVGESSQAALALLRPAVRQLRVDDPCRHPLVAYLGRALDDRLRARSHRLEARIPRR